MKCAGRGRRANRLHLSADRARRAILITGYPTAETRADGLRVGASGYLEKPVLSRVLMDLLDEPA